MHHTVQFTLQIFLKHGVYTLYSVHTQQCILHCIDLNFEVWREMVGLVGEEEEQPGKRCHPHPTPPQWHQLKYLWSECKDIFEVNVNLLSAIRGTICMEEIWIFTKFTWSQCKWKGTATPPPLLGIKRHEVHGWNMFIAIAVLPQRRFAKANGNGVQWLTV